MPITSHDFQEIGHSLIINNTVITLADIDEENVLFQITSIDKNLPLPKITADPPDN